MPPVEFAPARGQDPATWMPPAADAACRCRASSSASDDQYGHVVEVVHRVRRVEDSVGGGLGAQPLAERLGGECSGLLQSVVQRQRWSFDQAVGDQDQRAVVVERKGLLGVVSAGVDSQ
jgi:hypothetical protein